MTVPSLKSTNLFKPIQIGNITLNQRIAHLPTTRFRATAEHVPTDLMLQYYTERSIVPGTLLIGEGTIPSEKLGILPNLPGLWNEQQSKAWKIIIDSVHKNGSFISIQLGTLGRAANPAILKQRGYEYSGASVIYLDEDSKKLAEDVGNPLKELTEDEIHDIVVNQIPNSVKLSLQAGFDIVEIHASSGYLFEQFIHPSSNKRTDKYGGSIENRTRFLLEVIDNLIYNEGIDAKKLAIRLSPYNTFRGSLGENESVHPIVNYGYLVSELQQRANKGHQLGYISVVENTPERSNTDFISQIWQGVIVKSIAFSESFDLNPVVKAVDTDDRTIIGFGRHFIANPDLIERLKNSLDLNPFDPPTFYSGTNLGYNTYSKYGQPLEIDQEAEKLHRGKSLV
ncbi:NAPDH dehydrogenase [Scheffersomyces coipomensis]|uniref:NAPDH dehydrogenase n=1 Tax=Scheffersomyces coipomensis TaxID=1788519 RepID=UPI00315D41DA